MFAVYPTAITPADAEKWGWQIAYAGSNDNTLSGRSSADWVEYSSAQKNANKALFVDVDTSKGRYPRTPVYVTSMTGQSHHWGVTGAASIYEATNQHFRVYLDHAVSQVRSINRMQCYVDRIGSMCSQCSQCSPCRQVSRLQV
jgi:hypothetical protein